MTEPRMFITDLDGTLFRSDHRFSTEDLEALEALGELGIIRVLATGRSVFSLERSVPAPLPIDYLIFSTGLGVARYPSPRAQTLKTASLSAHETRVIASRLDELGLDFMVQDPVPDNHVFLYRASGNGNRDFKTRIDFYPDHCKALTTPVDALGPASQFITMVPSGHSPRVVDSFREIFCDFNVIQTTSPFDGKTLWVEIFPKHVSKSRAAAWLVEQLGISRENVTAVGNDYNDEDLLEWAGKAFVVENGPGDLKERFAVVASNNEKGVSQAAQHLLTPP